MNSNLLTSDDPRSVLMVGDSSTILKRFYFLQRELVLMQAGWVPGMEHWESKLLLPEFLWQDMLVAADLRERVLELRYPERRITQDEESPLFQWWQGFRNAPHGLAFVTGLVKGLKPALKSAYQDYLALADSLDDGPTLRILHQALTDIDGQLVRWNAALQEFESVYPEMKSSSDRWLQGIQTSLEDPNLNFTTSEIQSGQTTFPSERHGGVPFAISRVGVRDRRFRKRTLFPWPDSLDPTRSPGEGLELQVRQAVHHLNEIWATEMAAACIFDLADSTPEEFLIDGARWCYDEARHCRMGFERLKNWGFQMEEMPMGSFSYDAGANADPITRLGIIYYFESTYIRTKSERMRIFAGLGDKLSSHDMDFDWADELIHTHYGTRWLKHLLENAAIPEDLQSLKDRSEACIQKIRQKATAVDRETIESMYQQTLKRANTLLQPERQAAL